MPRRKKNQDQSTANGSGPHLGHNGLDDDEKRLATIQGVAIIEDLTNQMNSLGAKRRAERARLKLLGISKTKIDYTLAMNKAIALDKLDEFLAERHDRATVERWMNLEIPAEQAEVYQPSRDQRVFEDGKIAGMSGEAKRAPDHLNQTDGQHWMDGWEQGHALRKVGRGNGQDAEDNRDLRPQFLQDRELDSSKANPLDSLANPQPTAEPEAKQ